MIPSTLMEITKPTGEFVWLAVIDEETERFWVYDFGTKKFHINKALTLDYEIDRELDYAGIDRARAIEIVTTVNRKINRRVRTEHADDPNGVPVDLVLGEDAVPSPRSLTRIKARAIANAASGTWVTWKVYSANQERLAQQNASDIRAGKIKTITNLAGPVGAEVYHRPDGMIEVRVMRGAHVARAAS